MNRLNLGPKLRPLLMALAACALAANVSTAAPSDPPAADDRAVRENVSRMEAGWNAKSGELFAKPFAEDADYVVINGLHIRGREAIDKGHQRIFDTVYKDSTLALTVRQVRFLRPDVALVHVNARNQVRQAGETREAGAIITLVMVRDAGAWKITAFQNTQVTVE
ncbi:MAG TPA: SgcJ/EcaC family oxidoreductase [Pyrinomonadaceae bacterium]|nr:SgcJ/EcaC family oxidoreductase [Pyrinomonadaceae bacterium]